MSKTTRKRSSKAIVSTKAIEIKKKPSNPFDENIFASPWKASDIILVVEGTKFHVHRQILTMHSPVFDAMFGGNFKEAKENKVELPGKKTEAMLQFLKLLYPDSMISTPKIGWSLSSGKSGNQQCQEIMYSVLHLADEYQTEELLRKSLGQIVITSKNVFEILPYASKYNHEMREQCVSHVAKNVRIDELVEMFTKLEEPLMKELLVARGRYLERSVDRAKNHPKFRQHYVETTDDSSSDTSSSSAD